MTPLSRLFSLLKSLNSSGNVKADTGSIRASLPALRGWYQTRQHFSAVHLRPELPEPSDFTGSRVYIYIYLSFYPPWHHPLWCGENLGKFVHLHAQKSGNNSRSGARDLSFKKGGFDERRDAGPGSGEWAAGDAGGFSHRREKKKDKRSRVIV